MKKILIISVLFTIAFSSFIMGMTQPELAGAELELFKAIDNGDAKQVQRLIDEGVNFKVTRMYKGTGIAPINFAAQEGKNPKVLEIIQEAYNAKLTPNDRFLAAIKEDDLDKAEKIIINGKIENVDNPRDKNGNTALILAVQANNIKLIAELLLWKADINIQNKEGESALTLALKSKNKSLITLLLENAYSIAIDQSDKDGNTPLMLAVGTDDPDIIEKIVGEVPDPTLTNAKGETADNFIKVTPNKEKILKLLQKAEQQYALLEAISQDKFGTIISFDRSLLNISSAERNPLVVAISLKNKKLAEEIINKGADVNQILRGNKTPLWRAVSLANNDTFKLLLEKGAKPDVADIYDEYTPIFLALNNNKSVLVQYLIDNKANKANINYQASSKFPGKPGKTTPLMFVVSKNADSDFVKTLLDAGADPLLKNSEGKTALDLARENEKATLSPSSREAYQKIITLLENKMKTIPAKPTTPVTPVTPSTPPVQPTQLISLLHNLTQQLRMLLKVLQKN